jgi:hypothetical protein
MVLSLRSWNPDSRWKVNDVTTDIYPNIRQFFNTNLVWKLGGHLIIEQKFKHVLCRYFTENWSWRRLSCIVLYVGKCCIWFYLYYMLKNWIIIWWGNTCLRHIFNLTDARSVKDLTRPILQYFGTCKCWSCWGDGSECKADELQGVPVSED